MPTIIYHVVAEIIKDIPMLDSDAGKANIARWGADVKADIDSVLSGKDPDIPYTVQADVPQQILSIGTIGVKAQNFLNQNEIERYEALHNLYLEKLKNYIQFLTTNRESPQVQIVSASRAYQSEPLASDPFPSI